ncbi:MAG: TSUP family transporter [Actinomycetota bacterium]|nr:TSUP family transporter [Actinomycetota bacterium]
MTLQLVVLPLGVLVGALTQRITGVGFALVAAPLLVLVGGPFQGILLANLLGSIVAAVVLLSSWRDVDWRKAVLLGIPALIAVPIGAWVARTLPPAPLLVLVGLLVVIALTAVLLSERARVLRGPGGAVAAGAASGFMNVTAGVGGPAIVLYAVSTAWEHRRFLATFQAYTVVVSVASMLAKGGLPLVSSAQLLLCLAGLAAGLAGGQVLSGRVDHESARRLAIGLALVSAVATVLKGVLTW